MRVVRTVNSFGVANLNYKQVTHALEDVEKLPNGKLKKELKAFFEEIKDNIEHHRYREVEISYVD